MPIIISKEGKDAKRLERTSFKDICFFQIRHYGAIYFYALNSEKIRMLNDMGFDIPEDAKEKEPRLDIFKKQVSLDDFKKVIRDYIEKVREDIAS